MQSKIRVLDEHTINQIAAGEVIENPASVVKELVENSLDAGASEVCIEIKGGGRQLIRITDNGSGMSPDDALLCLERHATSKIKEVEDIFSVGTMGFRGEAIPSIASISKFTLLTRPKEQPTGTMVIVDGGKIASAHPVSCPEGSTIEVKHLFFNVPVRKKFQRSPTYDANEIHKVVALLSLAYPSVAFTYINNGKAEMRTVCSEKPDFLGQLNDRIVEVLGAEVPSAVCPLDAECGEYKISGYIGMPHLTRHNRTGQYLFINQRAVVSPLVSFAVRDGYGTALSTNRHPVFVLHLTVPGSTVDVNVHPQKREVRLRHEVQLKEVLIKAVQDALRTTIRSDEELFPMDPPSFQDCGITIDPSFFSPPSENRADVVVLEKPQIREVPPIKEEAPHLFEEQLSQVRSAKVLATIPKFIVIDSSVMGEAEGDGVCFVDQRAAHSRIIYEKLLAIHEKETHSFQQQLLIPYTFQTTPNEAAQMKECLDELNGMGIAIKEFGPNTFFIDALPTVFGKMDIDALLNELVDRLRNDHDMMSFKKEFQKNMALAASRAAISGSKKMGLHEAQLLVDQLIRCETPFHCPLGRPTMIHLSGNAIAKQFQKR